MSRIGKKPIEIPKEVEVKISGNLVTIKGPKGEQCLKIRPEIKVEIKEGKIFVSPQIETKKTRAFWGLTRSLLANNVKGVITGYEKKLVIEGLGFKAVLEGEELVLRVGFTHPVKIKTPKGIKFSVDKNVITVSGINKELVGQITAKIRKVRPPEPYKGKGIKYLGEVIKRKPGKKVVTAG
ncbi:50S ribosomal protein L6 [Patescibacteria group bacterium]|nr:50S ribosomal protein L6 [Patescibacteria group bacterium]